MTLSLSDWIVLGLICVSVIISIVWQIRLHHRNHTSEQSQAMQQEQTEEAK